MAIRYGVVIEDMHKSMVVALGLSQLAWGGDEVAGHARVALLVSSSSYQAGKAMMAAVSMDYESGWHGYWINPGEGGMKTEVKWELPAGWTAGSLQFPVPQREMTGGLACYGYAGKILIPVSFTPPADAKEDVEIVGKISWLACNEKECIPGSATLRVKLNKGELHEGADSESIGKAWQMLPILDEKITATWEEKDGLVKIMLSGTDHLNFEGAEIFPVTEQALDPGSSILLKKSSTGYETTVKKNEYAQGAIAKIELVIAGGALKNALRVICHTKG